MGGAPHPMNNDKGAPGVDLHGRSWPRNDHRLTTSTRPAANGRAGH